MMCAWHPRVHTLDCQAVANVNKAPKLAPGRALSVVLHPPKYIWMLTCLRFAIVHKNFMWLPARWLTSTIMSRIVPLP